MLSPSRASASLLENPTATRSTGDAAPTPDAFTRLTVVSAWVGMIGSMNEGMRYALCVMRYPLVEGRKSKVETGAGWIVSAFLAILAVCFGLVEFIAAD